jgi:hypothetical protein
MVVETESTNCLSFDIYSDLVVLVHAVIIFKLIMIVRQIFNNNFAEIDLTLPRMSNINILVVAWPRC